MLKGMPKREPSSKRPALPDIVERGRVRRGQVQEARSIADIPFEERKEEAKRPLYLWRYE